MSLDSFLKKFIVSEKGAPVNYTKIGNKELNVYGNKYFIPEDKTNDFYKAYKKYVFQEQKEAYLTEKQLEQGKILIDLDFRYPLEIEERQHNKEHIMDFIELCINAFVDTFKCITGDMIEFYVFEKDNLNFCDDVVKDGIHIIINICCDYAVKMMIRDYIIKNINDIWSDLPIKNTWNEVVDEGVMKGHVNWQLYGSRKPGYESYKLKYIYNTSIGDDDCIELEEVDVKTIDFDKYFPLFCARNNTNLRQFRVKEEQKDVYEQYKQQLLFKKPSGNKSHKIKKRGRSSCMDYSSISSEEELNDTLEELFYDPDTEYKLKEIHNYTMTLGREYWGPGSYDKWIRVGWALKNTSEKLYLTWLKMSSQSEDFSFQNNDLYEYWSNFDVFNQEGLSSRSIIYWSKTNNPEEYEKIHKKTVDYYIYYSFYNNTEVDLANTLHQMYKHQFVCAAIKDKMWYEFVNNKWILTDSGVSLRLKISTDMYKEYSNKVFEYQMKAQATQNNISISNEQSSGASEPPVTPQQKASHLNKEGGGNVMLNAMENKIIEKYTNDDNFSDFKKKMNDMLATSKLLKKTTTKGNIMKEAAELFYDKEFLSKLDTNPYLLGCSNGVIDFKEGCHRKGRPDDYIHKSTNLVYKPLSYYKEHSPKIIEEINTFFEQLFPNSSLRGYMWEHLASTLLGTNQNQTFNIYTGSGANGKSKLVELMNLVLGEYKGTVPISLVTQKRTNIGSTSSEIFNLIGTRYAVMQEPSKGDKINEGIMKELTGGDPIQCRALFRDSVTFVPQFKLVVCTNTLFDIVSNDDGTWRRLRKVDFESKFLKNPYKDPKFPVSDYPYQFQIDTKIDEKFVIWAPIFLSMLAEIAFKTKGSVQDVEVVMAATESYRQDQDVFLEFHNQFINPFPSPTGGFGVKFNDLMQRFKEWYTRTYNGKNVPTGKDVQKYFENRYGKQTNGGWKKISFKFETEQYEEEENDKDFGATKEI